MREGKTYRYLIWNQSGAGPVHARHPLACSAPLDLAGHAPGRAHAAGPARLRLLHQQSRLRARIDRAHDEARLDRARRRRLSSISRRTAFSIAWCATSSAPWSRSAKAKSRAADFGGSCAPAARSAAPETAPACGLYLMNVRYGFRSIAKERAAQESSARRPITCRSFWSSRRFRRIPAPSRVSAPRRIRCCIWSSRSDSASTTGP